MSNPFEAPASDPRYDDTLPDAPLIITVMLCAAVEAALVGYYLGVLTTTGF